MAENVLLSVLIIAIAMALLAVRVIVVKGGKMKSQHVKDNPRLRKENISCVLDQDRQERMRAEIKE